MKKIKLKKGKIIRKIENNEHISKFTKTWKKTNLFEKILTLIMLILVFVFILAFVFMVYIVISSPNFDVENLYTIEASIIYDKDGNEIARLGTENRERVSYEDLPDVFVDALVATEDSRFFQHNGVDLARFLKASFGQLLGNSGAGGASTLTMQIVKQRYTDSNSSGIKGIIRKFTDVYMSVFKIEKKYTKEQIIEYYVNIPGLGSGAFGIEQASQVYFGKSISEVTLPEAAMLAGLFQAPSAYNPYDYPEKANARKNQVLNLMERHGYISSEECEIAKSINVTDLLSKSSVSRNRNQGFINTVVEEVVKRTGKDPYLVSMKIYSTMDQSKQDVINDIYNGKTHTWVNDKIQAGVAVTDVHNGSIVAVGAGRNKGERTYNYATMINRHPGSSIKPIMDYGPAIEYLNWSTGQMVVDDAYGYSNGVSIKNWNNTFEGIETIRKALAGSRNIPALYAFQQLSQDQINTFATGLGITPEYDADGYINEAHSIGGFNGVTPMQMSAAYATFARGGIYIEPYSFTKIEFIESGEIYTVTPEKRTVMADSTAYMITSILRTAVTGGYVSAGSKSGTDICSKTGTSTVDSKVKEAFGIKKAIIGDSWQVTFSPDYAYAVWVGYDKITSTQYLTSNDGSKTKKSITKALTSGLNDKNRTFKKPDSVVSATIELETNPVQLASEFTPEKLRADELFKVGTVPDEVSTRFSLLNDPTNLKATSLPGTSNISLSWDPIQTPDAINPAYLDEYFKNGFHVWAEKYYNLRLQYNNANIGGIGYEVYIDNGSGFSYLGYTNSSSYTYSGFTNQSTRFMVKSAYSLFKSNKSNGAIINLESLTPEPIINWNIELNGNRNMTVSEYNNFIANGNKPLTVYNNQQDVTLSTDTNLYTSCWDDETDQQVDCGNLDCNKSYTLQHGAKYKNSSASKTQERYLSAGC